MNLYHLLYEGKAKNAPQEEPKTAFARFVLLLWREGFTLVKLNLLFLLSCLPILTTGPALGALAAIAGKLVRDEPILLWQDYWAAFRKTFWPCFWSGLFLGGLLRRPLCGRCGGGSAAGERLAVCGDLMRMRNMAAFMRRGGLSVSAVWRDGAVCMEKGVDSLPVLSAACAAQCTADNGSIPALCAFAAIFPAGDPVCPVFQFNTGCPLPSGCGLEEDLIGRLFR